MASATYISPVEMSEMRSEFEEFKTQHGKVYTAQENEVRFAYYQANMKQIDDLNAESAITGGATFAPNRLTDQSPAEIQRLMGFRRPVKRTHSGASTFGGNDMAVPADIDYRHDGAITPVKDQLTPKFCGNCYAISATGALESVWFLSGNRTKLQALSVSQATECETVDGGCEDGGEPQNVFDYYLKKGAELETDYPEDNGDGKTHKCQFNANKVVVFPDSYSDINCDKTSKGDKVIQQALATYGPLSVCLYASATAFDNYAKGVLTAKQCGTKSPDHCALLVGYNTTASTPYWIIKNSFGTDWGVKGYLQLEMGTNACRMNEDVISVSVSNSTLL